jgi:hypothetical protein
VLHFYQKNRKSGRIWEKSRVNAKKIK